MSSVEDFVRRGETPPSGQQPRQDRKAIGAKAKVSTKKSKPNQSRGSQSLSSTAPPPGHGSNSTAARNTYPQQQYAQYAQHVPPPNFGPFDEPVPSEFDNTRSDIGAHDGYQEGQRQYKGANNIGAPDNDSPSDDVDTEGEGPPSAGAYRGDVQEYVSPGPPRHHHRLTHQSGRSPIINNEAEQHNYPIPRGISGRFSQHPGGQMGNHHGKMELRYSHYGEAEPQPHNDSKKRPRGLDDDPTREGQNQQPMFEQYELPRRRDDDTEQSQNGFSMLEGTSAHVAPSGSPRDRQRQQDLDNLDDQRLLFDPSVHGPVYSDQQLEKMDYRQLKDTTWEVEEDATIRDAPEQPTGPLGTRFQNILQLKDTNSMVQISFFSKLSIAEWEEAGDLFMEKFAELMTKMKEQRRARRVMMSEYERRIEEHEGLVRGTSENLDKKLKDMKKGGEGVLRGKFP